MDRELEERERIEEKQLVETKKGKWTREDQCD